LAQKQKYKTGDIVQLKSGGPKMTVSQYQSLSLDDAANVQCTWFAGSKHQAGWFPEDGLQPAKD
jgi:uncharacterized protein YodC (DUF2158 family)